MSSVKLLAGCGVLLVAIVAAWYFLRESGSTLSVTNYPSRGTDIIAFGDSLVAGSGATEGNDFVSQLSKQIEQPIINLGVPGDTTARGLSRVSDIDAYNPKVVLVLLGGNDRLQRVPPETTFSNLGKIIEYIHSKGAVVLLLGIQGNLLSDPYAKEFEKLRDTYTTAYVSNVLSGVFSKAEYMSDAVHPNDAGYAIIAERIYPVLQPLLK